MRDSSLVDDEQWAWAQTQARMLMRHFADMLAIDRLGELADSVSGNVPCSWRLSRRWPTSARLGGEGSQTLRY
jgi:hypothetical protein